MMARRGEKGALFQAAASAPPERTSAPNPSPQGGGERESVR
jgi:hypothetical protein